MLKLQIFKHTLHATHLLKLLDKMCKYEIDPANIVEDTEWTRFCPQTNRQTDRQTDRHTDRWTRKPVYPPSNFVEAGGIKIHIHYFIVVFTFIFARYCDSWWHMKCAQHAAHNPIFQKMGLFRHSRWWYGKIKGPTNMIEGNQKTPTPTHG